MMVPEDQLTPEERDYLLKLARNALTCGVRGEPLPALEEQALTPRLRQPGASFVTLTIAGMLRGCIGALEPYQSLAEDVREHAVAAALQDYRFPQVRPGEVDDIEIEISRLTAPIELQYESPEDLLRKLRPEIDGVVLRDGMRRATFLPQVWEKIPRSEDFLSQLCMKMGAPSDFWRKKHLSVLIYQVEEFRESK